VGAPPLVYTPGMQTLLPDRRSHLPLGTAAGALAFLLLLSAVLASAQPSRTASSPATGSAEVAEAGSPAAGSAEFAEADGTVAHPYTDFEEGKAGAREQEKPFLVLFSTGNCAFTKLFFERTVPDPSVQIAFSELVFATIDVARGKGKFLGKMHEVTVTPTFVLYDPDRGPLHQWKGWGQVAFLQNLGGAIRSNTPVVDRLKRYETAPTAEDAALLGFFHSSTGKFSDALPEFRKAEQLNPEFDFTAEKFDAAASGYAGGQIPITDLETTANEVVGKADSAEEFVNVAAVMVNVTERAGAGERAAPYLRLALEKAAGSERTDIRDAVRRLEPYRLLYLDSDPDGAVASYQENFPGWPTDPDALNNVAWWCLTHDTHLEQAEGWSRQAVSGYTDPKDRANARDTLADILVRRNKKDEAIEQLFKAFEEAPEVTAYGYKLRDLGGEVEMTEPDSRATINGEEAKPLMEWVGDRATDRSHGPVTTPPTKAHGRRGNHRPGHREKESAL